MQFKIDENSIKVEHNSEEYIFEIKEDRVVIPKDDVEIPEKVNERLREMNYFVKNYPQTTIFNLHFPRNYDLIPADEDYIKEGSE